MKKLTLAALFASQVALAEIKHIAATGSFGGATTSQMLLEVESSALEQMIEACGSLEKIVRAYNIKITLESSFSGVNHAGMPGKDLLFFRNYPPSYLEADVLCAEE